MNDFTEFDANAVFPWLKQALPLEAAPGEPGGEVFEADLPSLEFLGDLSIMFAIDRDGHYELLQRHAVPPGMSEADLLALAKKNLSEQVQFDLTGTNYGGYGILADGDHEANALCLDFIWDAIAGQIKKNLVVAVPARDCLFMADAAAPEQIAAMVAVAADIFTNGERTLTDTLFFFEAESKTFTVYGDLESA